MARLRLGVLISGRGSNLQALIDACQQPDYPAEIALVISNEPKAIGLERAAHARVSTRIVDHRDFRDRGLFESEVDAVLRAASVDLVCLAGFMRLLTEPFVTRWRDWLINIHPSLLPAYKGLETHTRVLADGVRFTGCTVHFVRPEMDDGPIIVQAVVPVLPADDETTLAARVLMAEHRCYPLAVKLIGDRRVRVDGRRVLVDGVARSDQVVLNPPG